MSFIFLKKKLNNNPKNILYILYMNWKYVLNTFIIILIIIVFLDKIYRKSPQNKVNTPLINTPQENNVQENFESKQNIIPPTLGKELVGNSSLEKNFIIRPGNFYSSNENIVNFPSNVLDVSQYYVRNFPNSNQNLSESSNEGIIERNKEGQSNFSNYNYENDIQNNPHMWNYQNDLVMNGGKIGDFIGNGYYDLNYAFAENKYTNKQMRDEVMNDYKNDDLRMGLGVPAKMETEFDD
jgi:hypothetical protein